MMHRCYLKTPIGVLAVEENGSAITALYLKGETELSVDEAYGKEWQNKIGNKAAFEQEFCLVTNPEPDFPMTDLLKRAVLQLTEYFQGRRKIFDLPIKPQGTEFQKKVWAALGSIPYGETRTYGKIAAQIGNPKACRAVGGANNKNPILLLIPCHRVVGADGALTGFACGLKMKEYLLRLEENHRENTI